MTGTSDRIDVYLEIGAKRTFAGALDWPGWCRSGRDEAAALRALFEYGPRYARALRQARLGFRAPSDVSDFVVRERLAGNATTDFGAPDMPTAHDSDPIESAELRRFQGVLKAGWRAFDAAVGAAPGKELRKGPRGGGRELDKIVRHLLESDAAYLALLGVRFKFAEGGDPQQELDRTRQAILASLAAAVRGEYPAAGPRGGVRWTPRRFVHRVAWHALDHAWEIEDRLR
ncbi:MAG: DinB family protein [Anaerolineales bacterium]